MFENIIRMVYPPKCIFCGDVLSLKHNIEVCDSCFSKIPFLKGRLAVGYRKGEAVFFDEVVCMCEYSGIIKHVLINYKFFEKPSGYRALGKLLANKLTEIIKFKNFDIIVYVPLHKERERLRGYNQSQLISVEVSRQTGVPYRTDVLLRTVNTRSQSLLTREERLQNIKGAFKIKNADIIIGKSILLIDDIFTTGSTLNECSKVLKEAGAESVVVAVIASGRKY